MVEEGRSPRSTFGPERHKLVTVIVRRTSPWTLSSTPTRPEDFETAEALLRTAAGLS